MRCPVPAFVVLGLALCAGCTYPVHVRGVEVMPGAAEVGKRAVWVVRAPEMPADDASIPRIVSKLQWLLEQRGYHVAPAEEADLALLFTSEIQPLESRMRLQPPAGGKAGMTTVYREGPYERTLSLRLVRAAPFRADQTEETFWTGGALLHGAPTEGTTFEDALLLALFKHFPRDTGKTVEMSVHLDSPQARRLRRGVAEAGKP